MNFSVFTDLLLAKMLRKTIAKPYQKTYLGNLIERKIDKSTQEFLLGIYTLKYKV